MCCESCIRYEKCLEDDHMKDDCCPRCPEFNECSSVEKQQKDDHSHMDPHGKEEDYY